MYLCNNSYPKKKYAVSVFPGKYHVYWDIHTSEIMLHALILVHTIYMYMMNSFPIALNVFFLVTIFYTCKPKITKDQVIK